MLRSCLLIGLLLSLTSFGLNLKLVSYNAMLVCVGPWCLLADSPDREERLAAIGPWLKSLSADVVSVQEIWKPDQFDSLSKSSGFAYHHYFGRKTEQALFSRFPIEDASFTPFTWQASYFQDCKRLTFATPQGGVGVAFVRLPDGSRVAVVSTHTLPRWAQLEGFASPADVNTEGRKLIFLELFQTVAQRVPAGTPLVLMGDLNMNQISEEYAFFNLHGGLVDTFHRIAGESWGSQCTYCTDNHYVKLQNAPGEGILDYVMTTEDFKTVSSRILTEGGKYSDHLGVESVVEYIGGKGGFKPKPASVAELDRMLNYVDTVSMSPVCWLAGPAAWFQRARARDRIASWR